MMDDDALISWLHLWMLWAIWYIPTRYPINYYVLLKHRMVFLYFLHPRWVLQRWVRYLRQFSKNCGGRRTTLHGTILVEQQRLHTTINIWYIRSDSTAYPVCFGRMGIFRGSDSGWCTKCTHDTHKMLCALSCMHKWCSGGWSNTIEVLEDCIIDL